MAFIPSHGPNCKPDKPEGGKFPKMPCRLCGEIVTFVKCTCPRPSRFFLHSSEKGHGRDSFPDIGQEHKCEHTALHRHAREVFKGQNIQQKLRNGETVFAILQETVEAWNDKDGMSENARANAEKFRIFLRKDIVNEWVSELFVSEGMTYDSIWRHIYELNSNMEFKREALAALNSQRPRPRPRRRK